MKILMWWSLCGRVQKSTRKIWTEICPLYVFILFSNFSCVPHLSPSIWPCPRQRWSHVVAMLRYYTPWRPHLAPRPFKRALLRLLRRRRPVAMETLVEALEKVVEETGVARWLLPHPHPRPHVCVNTPIPAVRSRLSRGECAAVTEHGNHVSPSGCTNGAKRGGLCRRHGAFRLGTCGTAGCKRVSHTGGFRDSHQPLITNTAVKASIKTRKRKRCNFEGCNSGVVEWRRLCCTWRHMDA